jgi:O-antigen ligase
MSLAYAPRHPSNDNALTSAISHLLFAATLGIACFYQLSETVKLLTPVLCLAISAYGLLLPHQPGRFIAYGFSALVVCLALLSAIDLMPDAWTHTRANLLLAQRASAHFLFPFTAFGFAAMLYALGPVLPKLALVYLIPISLAALLVYANTDQAGTTERIFIINNLYALETFRLFFIATILLNLKNRALFLITLAALFFIAFSLQAILVVALLGIARFVPVKRSLVIIFLACLPILALISIAFWQQLLAIDNNVGVRALFWRDALQALLQSGFAGVGYGTESIVPFYENGETVRYFAPLDHANPTAIGVHSSFFQILFNAGIAGLILIAGWMMICVLRLATKSQPLASLDLLATGMLAISFFSNMAIDSYNFLPGSAFLMGWIIYRGNLLAAAPAPAPADGQSAANW